MKAYYSDYVERYLRFYAQDIQPEHPSPADVCGLDACEAIVSKLSDRDKPLFYQLYGCDGNIAKTISRISFEKGVPEQHLWKLVTSIERQVAEVRGLI